ncbi:segregation and condensation protein A [Novosphingobium fuchskuhlense]|uniref:segregation and condensation protein A n=1 Tax=Novosphingobium fuchskuhlense TaxID=1117702 RepID=UPI0009E713F0|nr:ScpA family protein [Novosphingobium fuchskuhlense]
MDEVALSDPLPADDWDDTVLDVPPEAREGEPDTLTLAIDGWEGPLHLLLDLARRQKVDLRKISILALVDQYLAFVERAGAQRLELAADYLVMAAWLAWLKSLLLLPRDPEVQPSPEELALRLQLRLQRLGAMREAGARLMARDRLGRDVFPRGAPEGLRTLRQVRWQCDLFALMQAYGHIQHRGRPVVHMVRARPVMTLEAAIARVEALIGVAIDWTALTSFLPPSEPDTDPRLVRSALASSFVAALELAKQGKVEIAQAETFAPLMLRRCAG